jgi:hypothetical protein
LYYRAEDVEGLIGCIETLRSDPAKRDRLGRNAYKEYETKFAAEAVYASMIEHLQGLALGSPRGN